MAQNFSELANLIWSVAELLRSDYKQSDYGKVILPFTLLRRIECVLAPTKDAALAEYAKRSTEGVNVDPFLRRKTKHAFYNVSPFKRPALIADPQHVRHNMVAYIGDFSQDARDVFERFKFVERVAESEEKDLLFQVVQAFSKVDLHPDNVPNETMGLVVEQRARVALLEARLSKLDELSSHSQAHINRLREYRSSLISAAVTGQLDINSYKEAA